MMKKIKKKMKSSATMNGGQATTRICSYFSIEHAIALNRQRAINVCDLLKIFFVNGNRWENVERLDC